MLLKVLHDCVGDGHILEHSFQFGGELTAALCFQLGNHVLLTVITDRFVEEQAFGQVLLVVSLKHILLLQETEQHHCLVEDCLNLLLTHAPHSLL